MGKSFFFKSQKVAQKPYDLLGLRYENKEKKKNIHVNILFWIRVCLHLKEISGLCNKGRIYYSACISLGQHGPKELDCPQYSDG